MTAGQKPYKGKCVRLDKRLREGQGAKAGGTQDHEGVECTVVEQSWGKIHRSEAALNGSIFARLVREHRREAN